MTEQEWLTCNDSGKMFEVFGGVFGKMRHDSRLRRFAVECCRRVRHLLTEKVFLTAADAGEAFADDPCNKKSTIKLMAESALFGCRHVRRFAFTADRHQLHAARAAIATCAETDWQAASHAMRESAQAVNQIASDRNDPVELQYQAMLLRCIVGNPFRPVTFNPAWVTPTVQALADAVYQNWKLPSGHLDAERLAVLADALEDAGCDKADILNHYRQPGEHVRGCWILDAILRREQSS